MDTNCNLDEYALQIEQTIKEALRTNTTYQKVIKKPWISQHTMNLAEEKRKVNVQKPLQPGKEIGENGQRHLDSRTM